MSNGFERRKEQSKEDIRAAAWELFGRFGVERVSMADIARRAGVSQATIYNNFGSKDALAREFVARAIAELAERVQAVLAPERPYAEKMTAMIDFIAEMLAAEPPAPGEDPVFITSLALETDAEMRKIRDAAHAQMTGMLLALVREGQAQGVAAADLSDEALELYFAAFMNLFTDPRVRRRSYGNPRLARELGALLTRGLSGGNYASP